MTLLVAPDDMTLRDASADAPTPAALCWLFLDDEESEKAMCLCEPCAAKLARTDLLESAAAATKTERLDRILRESARPVRVN
jgi:hypothetical protein